MIDKLKHLFVTFALTTALAFVPTMVEGIGPGPTLLFEMMGSDDCETIPADMPEEELQAGIEGMRAEGLPLTEAQLEGFSAGGRHGYSLFGSYEPRSGFVSMHSIWGEMEDVGRVTLCLITAQSRDVPIETGRFEVADPRGDDSPEPDSIIAMGVVKELAKTGDQTDDGADIFRERILAEVMFTSGHFELEEWSEEGYSATMQLTGEVLMSDDDQTHSLSLEATVNGMPGMTNVPDFSLDD